MPRISIIALTALVATSIAYAANEKNYIICTADNCPTISPVLRDGEELTDQAIVYESTKNIGFMQRSERPFAEKANGGWQHISINQTNYKNTYPVLGFGGAFTDSASHLYHHMTPALQNHFLQAYYSHDGIRYSLGRVPIASNDFSCRRYTDKDTKVSIPSISLCEDAPSQYSYHDAIDNKLENFSLAPEDILFKAPLIHAANKAAANPIRLFASPWSAPAWMKSNGSMVRGSLLPQFQAIWANYFIKFLQAYKQLGISFWGLTVQNEPVESNLPGQSGLQTWQTMFYTKEQEATFIKEYLGPALSQFAPDYGSPIHLIAHDDQLATIAERMTMLNDPELAQYVSGAGLHWYMNYPGLYGRLDSAYEILNHAQPEQSRFIIATEACQGYLPTDHGPKIGDWSRGESYAHDIINDFNHHVSGWMDWNLVLDMNGGPNWAKNYVDAPMLFDKENQSLLIQPMYYYFGHFSKFINPEAKMLESESKGWFALEEVAFKVKAYANLPDTIVIVVLNRDMTGRKYYIADETDKNHIRYLNLEIPAHSIQTIIYKAKA